MIISSLETFTRQQLGMVRVRTKDGAEGMGQFSPFNADITAPIFHRQIAPWSWARTSGMRAQTISTAWPTISSRPPTSSPAAISVAR